MFLRLFKCLQSVGSFAALVILLAGSSIAQNSSAQVSSEKSSSDQSSSALSLFQRLTDDGVIVSEDTVVVLPTPTVKQSSNVDVRQSGTLTTALSDVAKPYGWAKFSRNSVYAPVKISIDSITNSVKQKVGHEVYSAFIVYADVERLRDEELMQATFGDISKASENKPSGESDDARESGRNQIVLREVPELVLNELGLRAESGTRSNQTEKLSSSNDASRAGIPRDFERMYRYVEMPLLNKLVIRGIITIEREEHENQSIVSWQFVPGTEAISSEWQTSWTKVERNELGQPIESQPQPYRGFAGYLSVTKLPATAFPNSQLKDSKSKRSSPEEQGEVVSPLLVESYFVMHEPQAWFAGSAFLRSKLPSALQENAQRFRRELQ